MRPAFRRLHRQLLARRWSELGWLFRLELAALAALAGGFVFWQLRIAAAGVWLRHDEAGVAVLLGAWLLALALGCAATARAHVAWLLRSSPLRTTWLQWPVPEEALWGHLRWEARGRALLAAVLAAAVLAAGWGYASPLVLAVLTAGFGVAFEALVRLACGMALRRARQDRERLPTGGALARSLAIPPRPAARSRHAPARWRREPAWVAWWRKDAMVASRARAGRGALAAAAALGAASLAAWALPVHAAARYLLALSLGIGAFLAEAEWLVALAGRDPFTLVRCHPLGVGSVWLGRFAWVALATALLLAVHLSLMGRFPKEVGRLFALWLGGAGLGLGILGVNYGVTLMPRAGHAQRMLALSVALALVALVAFPPLGGPVALLTAVLHSSRRLGRWHRLEEA
jgi:hypothetical protein